MKWQRSIVNDGCWTDDQHSDFELQCQWKLAPLALRLAKARLLHAFHCAVAGPVILIDFITASAHQRRDGFAALRRAFTWLSEMDNCFCPRH